jgi:hypothetical protein
VARYAVGALEFFREGVPLGGIEVAPVEEGIFEGDSFIIEVVDGGGGEAVEPVGAGLARGNATQVGDLGEPAGDSV